MQNTNLVDSDSWIEDMFYSSSVYKLEKPSFLEVTKKAIDSADKYDSNDLYPLINTHALFNDASLNDFFSYVLNTAWTILDNQGYNLENYSTYFLECWGQLHKKNSGHDIHTHPFQSVISGFYFIDVPENSCKIQIADPRQGKTQLNLFEKNFDQVTQATPTIILSPKAGDMYFLNSWFPHGFTRNGADEIFSFIHFNIGVYDNRSFKMIYTNSETNINSENTEIV